MPEQPPPDEERLLEAALAQLPADLLAQLQTRSARLRQSSTGTAGEQHQHQQRGRPTGVFRGDHRRGGRVILATLRAAAPGNPYDGENTLSAMATHLPATTFDATTFTSRAFSSDETR